MFTSNEEQAASRPITRRNRKVKLLSQRNLQNSKYFPPGFFDNKSTAVEEGGDSPISPLTAVSRQEEALKRARLFIT